MPQFGFYPSQIFWLLISFGILYFAMRFFLLPPIEVILKKREDKVKTILREADKLTAEAERIEKSYKKYVDEASQDASRIIQTAHEEIAQTVAKTEEKLLQTLQSDTLCAQNSIKEQKNKILGRIEIISCNFLQDFLKVFYQTNLPKKDLNKKITASVGRLKNDL